MLQCIPSQVLGIAAQNDVGSPASHIGGNGDTIHSSRLSNNFRLTLVMLSVQHIVLDTVLSQFATEFF